MQRFVRITLFLLIGIFSSSCVYVLRSFNTVIYPNPTNIRVEIVTVLDNLELTLEAGNGLLSVEPHPMISYTETSNGGKTLFIKFLSPPPSARRSNDTYTISLETVKYTPIEVKKSDIITATAGFWIFTIQTELYVTMIYNTNEPPVNSVPSAQSVEAGQTLTLNFGVSDPDIGVGFYDIVFSVAQGKLTPPNGFNAIGAGEVVEERGNGVYIKTTAANVARYLQGMTYSAPNAPTTDTITMFTNDRGNNGDDGQKTDTDSVSITVLAPPPAPIAPPPAVESAPNTPLTLIGDAVTCADNATCSGAITAVGGVPPYSFAQTDSTNADFATLNTNGSYSFFVPTNTYTDSPFIWDIRVTDSTGATASKLYTLVVPNPAP